MLLNRPEALNALSGELMDALVRALEELDADAAVRCIVLGGSERVFAAGADVAELAAATPIELYENRRIDRWDAIRALRTPLVAAVSGYCLGGGCELAMLCDLIVASETAQFGQPEINLGVLPGAGGTQRLTRAVGKALAMDVILTGRFLSADEALRAGLVARVVAREAWLDEAKRVARAIAAKSPVSVRLAKESVDQAFEVAARRRGSSSSAALVLPRARVRRRDRGPDARSSRSASRTSRAASPLRPRLGQGHGRGPTQTSDSGERVLAHAVDPRLDARAGRRSAASAAGSGGTPARRPRPRAPRT